MTEISICIALHKPYWVPQSDIYMPIQVGSGQALQITRAVRDNTGDNISDLNPHYSELTAQYWAWKNITADYFGLTHYRRHFSGTGERGLLSERDLEGLLHKAPVILPTKTKYYIETLESHYCHTLAPTDMKALRATVNSTGPRYGSALDMHLRRRSGHMYNMHIMRSDLFEGYCTWLFPILEQLNSTIDFSERSPFEARCIGRLSEYLLDVWLTVNKIPYAEQPIISLERVNWTRKGSAFLAAKVFHKKYESSF